MDDNPPLGDDSNDFGNDNDMDDDNMDDDPKTYIQHLTGKLSQELRNYNQNQEESDSELNKYVAGMIIPQASKALTDDEKNEIIDKIRKGNIDTDDENEN